MIAPEITIKTHLPPILVAEDEPNDFVLLCRAFKKAGVENPLQCVTNGEQVLAYLSGTGDYALREKYPLPLLLLLDMKLPRMAGLEVLDWIHQQPGLRRLVVIAFTSSNARDAINQAYDRGANAVIIKPLEMDQLVRVARHLGDYWLRYNQVPDLSGRVRDPAGPPWSVGYENKPLL